MNISTHSSAVIFFDNFPIIIVSTVYPTLFLALCLFSLFRNKLKDCFSKKKTINFPFQKITTKELATKINANIAEIPLIKPSLVLADSDVPLDCENQSSTFYRMKIHDLGNELMLKYVDPVTYPYPKFSSYISYHLLECSCIGAEGDVARGQQALELYNDAIIGPADFTYVQLVSFKEKLNQLDQILSQCDHKNRWL